MGPDEVRKLLDTALGTFMGEQLELLELDVNERAVSAVFAHLYLRECFPDHKVDADYNRVGLAGDPKRLHLPEECGGQQRRVFPDIIVHQRGHNGANLLVIEIKMETNPQPRHCDHMKIEAFREQLGYQFGAFIDFPAGSGAGDRGPKIQWFGMNP